VVLYDAGISRRHARIFEKGGGYCVEDLGSSNGTKVNGAQIEGARALASGDTITLGPVIFAFALPEPAKARPSAEVPHQQTRIVDRAAVLPADRTGQEPELQALQARTTRAIPAVDVGGQPAAEAEAALAPVAVSSGLSAAERARLRRLAQQSLWGQLKLTWSELSGRARLATALSVMLLFFGSVGGLVYLYMPELVQRADLGPEPARLGALPIEHSFGLGEGVTFRRPDMKAFDFEFNTPTQAVVVLHFRAQDISEGEVGIIVNGVDLGQVPADIAGLPDRELEQVIPPRVLKRNERNQIIFDNVRNPPGREPWQISHLWVEVVPIPELGRDEILAAASLYVTKGGELVDQREVSAENVFKAWKSYRNAWLSLEALDDKPPVYQTARFQMNQLARELEQTCSRMMFDFQVAMRLRNRTKAANTLKEIAMYFPTPEHRCHNLARQKLLEHRL
jgi:hypothetical protein